jgi:hypothetical protein
MDTTKTPSRLGPVLAQPQEYLYDATLIQLDSARGVLTFAVGDTTQRVTSPHVSSFNIGAIGRLRLPSKDQDFAFNAYPDQRLRRAPTLDQPPERRWGWRIGERQFTVEAGVIPGRAGKVVKRDTQPLALELPREFVLLCKSRGIDPAQVLIKFIADLCGLTNLYNCPREDGYSCSGPEPCRISDEYFQNAWGEPGESSGRSGPRLKRGDLPKPP